MKIGQGFDAHRFGESEKSTTIRLGGVDVPANRSIVAHSDGDVLLHALCDALLGALGIGDIGEHFPDSDAKYNNIDSLVLLSECAEMVLKAGYRVENVDLTLIAETPRVANYRQRMRESIAHVLGVSVDQVNVKATTTEGMGFTGKQEGIAALGVALLETIDES